MKDENLSDTGNQPEAAASDGLGGMRPPVVRLRLWLETEDGMFFGSGRGMLLEAVERTGSLKGAAESLGMSYRAAWGKMRRTEKVLGVQLIEQAGSRKSGHRLTPAGRLLRDKFGQWFDAVERSAVDKARELFPWACLSFQEARHEGYAVKPPGDDKSPAGDDAD